MKTFSGRWNAFWHDSDPTVSFGLFRVLMGAALLLEVENSLTFSRFAIEGGFHLPYPWLPLPLLEASTFYALHLLQLPLALLLLLGFFARPAAGSLLLIQSYLFFTDQLNFRNHPYFFLLVLLALTLGPLDDAFSVPAAAAKRFLGKESPRTWRRLLQVQVSLVYLFAGFHKLKGPFLSGEIMRASPEQWIGPLGWFAPELSDFAWASLASGSAAIEIFLAFALWFPKTRIPGLILGLGLHAGIALSMNIWAFSLAICAAYLLFLEPAELRKRLQPFAKRLNV